MNALKKLQFAKPEKPYRGFSKLEEGYHRIDCFRIVKNRFAKRGEATTTSKSILVELHDQVVFLPQYFWQKLNEKDITELNEHINSGENIYLFFGGKQEEGG